jgi:hypothetical protein
MLWQAPEAEVFALSAANGISQIVWSPLAQGLLTGKYRAGQEPPADSRAAHSTMNTAMDLVMNDTTLAAVERLRPIAVHTGHSMAELALAWVLRVVVEIGPTGPVSVPASGPTGGRARTGSRASLPPEVAPCRTSLRAQAAGHRSVRVPRVAPGFLVWAGRRLL